MVGFRAYGRMGNFLFMAANCIAYAMKHGLNFSFPNRTTDPYWSPIYLFHLVDPHWIQGKEDILVNEKCHEFQEIPFHEEWRDKQIVLNGYFQSEAYFKDYRTLILDLFDFRWEQKDYCSIHVRRGDYVRLPEKHPPFSPEFFRATTSRLYMKGFDRFKVFSDDIAFCKDYFGNDPHYSAFKMEYSNNKNEVDDLIDGSCGIHQIGMSSTFYWWMCYLNRNPDKICYIPELWFTRGYALNTKDIVPEWFTKIPEYADKLASTIS